VAYARRALAEQTETLEQDRSNAKLSSQVVLTLNELGAAQSHAGDADNATITIERAIEIGDHLLARFPDHPGILRYLVISCNHLGLSFAKRAKLDESTASFGQALEHGRILQSMFPDHAETQSTLAGVLNNYGFLLQQQGQNAEAAQSFKDAIEAQSAAARLAPNVMRYKNLINQHRENLDSLLQAESGAKG
jgi:tetratricopeptide (TPR) repeat protein